MIAEATRATGRTTSTVKENERTEEKMDVDVDFEEEEEEENPISFAKEQAQAVERRVVDRETTDPGDEAGRGRGEEEEEENGDYGFER